MAEVVWFICVVLETLFYCLHAFSLNLFLLLHGQYIPKSRRLDLLIIHARYSLLFCRYILISFNIDSLSFEQQFKLVIYGLTISHFCALHTSKLNRLWLIVRITRNDENSLEHVTAIIYWIGWTICYDIICFWAFNLGSHPYRKMTASRFPRHANDVLLNRF